VDVDAEQSVEQEAGDAQIGFVCRKGAQFDARRAGALSRGDARRATVVRWIVIRDAWPVHLGQRGEGVAAVVAVSGEGDDRPFAPVARGHLRDGRAREANQRIRTVAPNGESVDQSHLHRRDG